MSTTLRAFEESRSRLTTRLWVGLGALLLRLKEQLPRHLASVELKDALRLVKILGQAIIS